LELRSELRSDALPATTIDFSGIRTHDSLRANRMDMKKLKGVLWDVCKSCLLTMASPEYKHGTMFNKSAVIAGVTR